MRSIREAAALAGALAIFAALAACAGPDATAPAAPSSLIAAAAPLTLTTPVGQLAPTVGVEPVSGTSSEEEDAKYQTCTLFRQMIEGIDYLSTDEQQQLILEMADVAQYTEDPDLTGAVADMGQGWLDSNPQQFASGMRALSQICGVPYE
jgi:NADPH-dependent curcumin reductase CurA